MFGTKGSSIHVQEILREFCERGAEVHLFATRLDGDAAPELSGVERHWLPALPRGDIAVRELASIGANAGLEAALRSAGDFDFVYERYSLWSFAAMDYAREAGVPGILEVNAPLIEEQERHRGLVNRSTAEGVASVVFAAASAILVVSREVADYLRRFPGTGDKVEIVPNGVNVDRIRPGVPPLYAPSPGSYTVGFVGTLKPWHGLPILARAFAKVLPQCPGARLLIGGDGPERETFEHDLRALNAFEATTFAGALPPASIPNLLASMDVAVAPYPAEELFYFSPLKVFEYMAAGLPIVASDIGQIAEVIEDGVTGLLCKPDDYDELAAVLEDLRGRPDFREKLGKAARLQAERAHTWAHVATRILELADAHGVALAARDSVVGATR